jgi:hypothetical protein
MSRRWYTSPDGRMVYVGWDRSLQKFFLSVVALCTECGGMGEDPGTEIPCPACMGDGVAHDKPSTNVGSASLADLSDELAKQCIPLPDKVRADLEQDQRTNAGELVHDYDQAR